MALDVYEEEEGIFFEDLSGQVLQDDELARLLTFPKVLITCAPGVPHPGGAGGYRPDTTVANLVALDSGRPFVDGSVLTSEPAASAISNLPLPHATA